MGDRSQDRGARVYVGGLSESIKKEDLEGEFEKFGKLNSVWVAFNPPGFAFIEFNNVTDAESACDNLNGADFLGVKLRVELAKDRRRGGPRGGFRGGRGFGGGDRGFRGGRGRGMGGRDRFNSFGGGRDRDGGGNRYGGRDFGRRSDSYGGGGRENGFRGRGGSRGGGSRFEDRFRSRSPGAGRR